MVHAALLQTIAIAIVAWDNHIYKGNGSTFTEYSGARVAKDVAMDRTGRPWIVGNDDSRIYYHDGLSWVILPTGLGNRIAVNKCGTPFVLGLDKLMWKWNGYFWFIVPGSLIADDISVDGKDRVWMVGVDKTVWYNEAGVMKKYADINTAKKIAGSSDGTPYIIGADDRAKKGNGTSFTDLGIAGKDIAISSSGTIWVIDSNNDSYFLTGGKWYKHPGTKPAIAITAA